MFDDESTGSGEAPEASASMASGAWDLVTSAADAVVNTAEAAASLSAAGGEAVLGAAAHVDAGLLEAVGAEGLAADIREGANTLQDYAAQDLSNAGDSITAAGDDVFGS